MRLLLPACLTLALIFSPFVHAEYEELKEAKDDKRVAAVLRQYFSKGKLVNGDEPIDEEKLGKWMEKIGLADTYTLPDFAAKALWKEAPDALADQAMKSFETGEWDQTRDRHALLVAESRIDRMIEKDGITALFGETKREFKTMCGYMLTASLPVAFFMSKVQRQPFLSLKTLKQGAGLALMMCTLQAVVSGMRLTHQREYSENEISRFLELARGSDPETARNLINRALSELNLKLGCREALQKLSHSIH